MIRAQIALASLALVACGVDNAVVGGRCRAGWFEVGSTCEYGDDRGTNVIAPTDPPETAGGTVNVAPANGIVDPTTPAATVPPLPPLDPPLTPPVIVPPDPDASIVCTAPLVECDGACIPVADDGQNCGACGKICPSNICVAGVCQGATPGDVVVIGHDFETAWSGSAQAKVLVNAMSLPTTNPIRVLSWETGAKPTAVANVWSLVGAAMHRKLAVTTASTPGDLASDALARSYDVVLIHDASGDDPSTLGASWSAALGAFTQGGGVVVALDGAASQMPALVTATGLLAIGGHDLLPDGAHLLVTAPSDTVGAGVLSPYAASGAAVGFTGATAESDTVHWIIEEEDAPQEPVVLHRVVR